MTVESFEVGAHVKVSGTSKGKGFQGTIKRHNFSRGPRSHGSHNVRAPGSIGASATPARVFKGIRGPGQMGNKRATQRGLEIVAVDKEENLLLVRGSVPGSLRWVRGGADRCLTPLLLGASKRVKLDESAFGARFLGPLVHQSVRAEQAARRRGYRGHQDARHGLRRRRQALAPEGHRSCPCGLQPFSAVDRRRHRVRTATRAPTPSRSTARSSVPRCAVLSHCTPSAARSRSSTPPRSRRPGRARRSICSTEWGQTRPTLVVLAAGRRSAALSFRNLARVAVLSTENVGVTDLVGAASLVVSEQALDALVARAGRARSAEEAKA